MKRSAYVLLKYEYDDERTTLVGIDAAVWCEPWPQQLRALHGPVLVETSLATSELADFDCVFTVADTADMPDRHDIDPLHFQVRLFSTAVGVTALGDMDQELGNVAIDYFNNKLQALVYRPENEEPEVAIVFSEDTDLSRRIGVDAEGD